jgi:hypothetical protein
MSEPRVLRPMEYGELFNEAFDLYKRNFLLFIGIGAVVYVPYSLVAVFLQRYPLVSVLLLLGLLIPMSAAGGATIKALADRYLGGEATIGASWSYVLRRLGRYLLTISLASLLLLATLVPAAILAYLAFFPFRSPVAIIAYVLSLPILCIPAIVVGFWIFFVLYVMIVEDRYYASAIRRSRELAAGQWLRIFLVTLLAGILAFGVSMITSTLMVILQFAFAPPSGPTGMPGNLPLPIALIQGLFNAALQTVIAPLTSVLGVLLYFDVRVRKEGFDVELLAREMGAAPLGGGPIFDLS